MGYPLKAFLILLFTLFVTCPVWAAEDGNEGVLRFGNYKLFKAQKVNKAVLSQLDKFSIGVVMGVDDLGGYAIYIAEKMVDKRSSAQPKLYVIDVGLSESDQRQLHRNIDIKGLSSVIQVIHGSHAASYAHLIKALGKDRIDFFFWDVEQGRKNVQTHLSDWWPFLRDGGIFLGDDYGNPQHKAVIPGLVDAFAQSAGLALNTVNVWDGKPWMWYFHKGRFAIHQDKGGDKPLTLSPQSQAYVSQLFSAVSSFTFGCQVFRGVTDELNPVSDIDWSNEARIAFFEGLSADTRARLDSITDTLPPRQIPLISHAIWLTDPRDPKDPARLQRGNGDSLLKYYLESLTVMGPDWTHILWCLYPDQIPVTKKLLQGRGVHVRSIYDGNWGIFLNMKAPHVFNSFLLENQFSVAANCLRQEILFQKGGLYRDITLQIKMDPRHFLRVADNIFSNRPYPSVRDKKFDYFDQDFCAASPENPIQGLYLRLLAHLNDPKFSPIVPILQRHFRPIPNSHPNLTRPAMLMYAVESVLRDPSGAFKPRVLWVNESEVFTRRGNNSRAHGRFGAKKESALTLDLFSVTKPPKYKELTAMYRRCINDVKVIDMTYLMHEIYKPFEYAHQEGFVLEIHKSRQQSYMAAEKALLSLHDVPETSDPLLFHRMWLTQDTEVPDELIQNFIDSFALQPKDALVYFWCLDPKKIPKTIACLKKGCPRKLEVKTIDRDLHDFEGRWLYDFYLKHKIWAPASDIARFFIVGEYGGLYSDVGMKLLCDMGPFMKKFDYMVGNFLKWLDMCFIYTRKGNPGYQRFLSFIANLKTNIPEKMRSAQMGRNLYLHNSLALMGSFDTMDLGTTLLVPDKTLFQRVGLNSWSKQKEGFGNAVNNPSVQHFSLFSS